MFVRVFLFSIILLLVSQACVRASTNSSQCSSGTARCCEEDSSQPGKVNDEECRDYSEPCESGYLTSCCYIVPNIHSRSELATVLLLLRTDWVRLRGVARFHQVRYLCSRRTSVALDFRPNLPNVITKHNLRTFITGTTRCALMKRKGEHGSSRYNPLTGTYTTSADPVRRWAGLQYGAKGQAFL
ncbi:hypothetical protein BD769DRAFT_1392750 [Suillus cothurnatus]|nr:hypothetical protein BD769DRAFT_1392750 [Suillus cothurnatus]